MKILPVTVISGFVGAGKSAVLRHVLRSLDGLTVAVIVNTTGDGSASDLQTSRATSVTSTGEKLIEMSRGCICCTMRQDLLSEVAELARQGRHDYLLIESNGIAEPRQVAETFAFVCENGDSLSVSARLDTMVTVVDAATFLDDFQCVDELRDRGIGTVDDDRDIARLLTDQVEFANVVLLNKTDLVSVEEAGQALALLKKLNPDARVLAIRDGEVLPEEILNTGRFGSERPDDSDSSQCIPLESDGDECDEYGLRRFAYRARRPFHPQRFWNFWMNSAQAPHILRSEGYFWLATRNQVSGLWSQTGQVLTAEPAGLWWAETRREDWPADDPELVAELESVWDDEWGDRRQELVIISHDMDHNGVSQALHACLLTDPEMDLGPIKWRQFDDPFGAWESGEDESGIDHQD